MFALAANAQSPIARATVPFEFAAGGAMMPAGEYTRRCPGFFRRHHAPWIGRKFGRAAHQLSRESAPDTTAAKLIFERRDGMAFLSAVEWPDQSAQ